MKGTVITQENPCKSIHTPMSEFGHVYFLKKPGVNVGRVLIWPEIDEFQHPLYRNLVIKEVSAFYTAWAAYRNSPPDTPPVPCQPCCCIGVPLTYRTHLRNSRKKKSPTFAHYDYRLQITPPTTT